jgi:type I restriction enzyme S subunit
MTATRVLHEKVRKRSEVAAVDQWPLVRLGDVCHIQLGKMLSPKSKTGRNPLPYLRNANVQWGRFELADVAEMDFDAPEQEKFLLQKGDLLVCEGGEPGRCAVWDGSIEPCYYQKALHRIRPREGAIDTEFLMYRLWHASRTGEFAGSQRKSTIAHLPLERLEAIRLHLPPVEEQRRVAALVREAFRALDHARAALRVQLDACDQLSQRLLADTFR